MYRSFVIPQKYTPTAPKIEKISAIVASLLSILFTELSFSNNTAEIPPYKIWKYSAIRRPIKQNK